MAPDAAPSGPGCGILAIHAASIGTDVRDLCPCTGGDSGPSFSNVNKESNVNGSEADVVRAAAAALRSIAREVPRGPWRWGARNWRSANQR